MTKFQSIVAPHVPVQCVFILKLHGLIYDMVSLKYHMQTLVTIHKFSYQQVMRSSNKNDT